MDSLYSAPADLDPLAILLMQEGEFEEAESLQEFHFAGTHVAHGWRGEEIEQAALAAEFHRRIAV